MKKTTRQNYKIKNIYSAQIVEEIETRSAEQALKVFARASVLRRLRKVVGHPLVIETCGDGAKAFYEAVSV